MDFMSILGRCLLLPFPVAMFVGCLLSLIRNAYECCCGMFIVVCHQTEEPTDKGRVSGL